MRNQYSLRRSFSFNRLCRPQRCRNRATRVPRRLAGSRPRSRRGSKGSRQVTIIVVTWLHKARRDVLKSIRGHRERPLTGVLRRSPDRPNPLGLHPVTVRSIAENRLLVGPIEAINGTPVVDIKPVSCTSREV